MASSSGQVVQSKKRVVWQKQQEFEKGKDKLNLRKHPTNQEASHTTLFVKMELRFSSSEPTSNEHYEDLLGKHAILVFIRHAPFLWSGLGGCDLTSLLPNPTILVGFTLSFGHVCFGLEKVDEILGQDGVRVELKPLTESSLVYIFG